MSKSVGRQRRLSFQGKVPEKRDAVKGKSKDLYWVPLSIQQYIDQSRYVKQLSWPG